MSDEEPVAVFFADGSHRTLALSRVSTAHELAAAVAAKLGLGETSVFCLWLVSPIVELELRGADASKPLLTLIAEWPAVELRAGAKAPKRGEPPRAAPQLVYRRQALIPLREERALVDPVATHLLFIQAVSDVIASRVLVSADQVVSLGGLQAQATFGDSGPAHRVGFLSTRLADFVPERLRAAKAPRKREFESEILAAHRALSGTLQLAAKANYLALVRGFRSYGSSYFAVELKRAKNTASKWPKAFSLGINDAGLYVLDTRLHEEQLYLGFADLKAWAATESTLELQIKGVDKVAEVSLATRAGGAIEALIATAVAGLLDRTSESISTSSSLPSVVASGASAEPGAGSAASSSRGGGASVATAAAAPGGHAAGLSRASARSRSGSKGSRSGSPSGSGSGSGSGSSSGSESSGTRIGPPPPVPQLLTSTSSTSVAAAAAPVHAEPVAVASVVPPSVARGRAQTAPVADEAKVAASLSPESERLLKLRELNALCDTMAGAILDCLDNW